MALIDRLTAVAEICADFLGDHEAVVFVYADFDKGEVKIGVHPEAQSRPDIPPEIDEVKIRTVNAYPAKCL